MSRTSLAGTWGALLLALQGIPSIGVAHPATLPGPPVFAAEDFVGSACGGAAARRFSGPEVVPLKATGRRPGAAGTLTLTPATTPYGISVSPEGGHRFRIVVDVTRLRRLPSEHYLVWAATPTLDRFTLVGELGGAGGVSATLDWNQFMVFVSAEARPDVERWEGPIVLRAVSPSSRMHTMAGHGPFEDLDCAAIF